MCAVPGQRFTVIIIPRLLSRVPGLTRVTSQATPLRGVGWRERERVSVADRLRTGGVSGTSLDRPEGAHGWNSDDDAAEGQRLESAPSRRQLCPCVALLTVRRASAVKAFVKRSSLVDPASSHMLVSKIKPCMSQCMPN